MAKQMIVVAIGSGAALATLKSFVEQGEGMARRPRTFEKDHGVWLGNIKYGDSHQYHINIDAVSAPSLASAPSADWYIIGSPSIRGHFVLSPKRLKEWYKTLPRGGKVLVVSESKSQQSVAKNAANQLAAEITSETLFRPNYLSFPGGNESQHFHTIANWVGEDRSFRLVSGCCLNADESRHGIVERLNPEITSLLCRTAKAAFDQVPVSEWYLYTFGPADYDFLGDLGIQKVLLPYMWNKPKSEVQPDMTKNYELLQGLVDELSQALPFPVRAGQLSDDTSRVDVPWLVEASRERASLMLPELMKHPPAIFNQLNGPQDILDRVQQEAFLYLLDTVRWGQVKGESRPPVCYVGVEVHGGYWENGNLCVGPHGEFLPLAWLPQCVRQHWGDWVLKNHTIAAERRHLASMLTHFGY